MARPLWKGLLSFGLVTVPIELHTAVRDHRPRFRLLHAKDRSPVRFERVCIRDGAPVAWEDLVKGYEYQKGQFVVVTKEDFKAAALEKTRTVDIIDFVDADEIDDRFFETPYYLVPGKGGERSYALLREAIRASQRIGIAKFILRDAQHLAAVEAIGDALVLTIMRFADELVDPAVLELPAASDIRPAELEMAKTLVHTLAAKWDPSKYTDEYRENLMRVIKGKAKGQKVVIEPEVEPRQAAVVDLMERLRQSLAKSSGRRSRRRAATHAPSAARAARHPAAKRSKHASKRPRRAA